MKIRNCCASLVPAVVVVMLAGAPGAVLAQETKVAAPATPAPVSPEAAAVLNKARAAYAKLKTYQDTTKLKFEMRAKDAEGNDQNQDDSEEMAFVFAGAKKFAMTHKDFAVYSDASTQTAHLKMLSQYIQKPAQDGLIEEAKIGPIGILGSLHVPANLLLAPVKFEKDFPLLSEITGVAAEEREGKAGKRVSGKGELPEMPFGETIPMTVWFADDTGLVGEVTMDLKPAYTEMTAGQMTISKATGTITFSDFKLDEEVPADAFTFKAGEGDKKVDSFGMGDGPDPQQELVGKASPDFKGSDLEGKPLNLSDLKGKVVLLDFWATWCGPCMQMIPKIQELSAEYADKGVVVVGMNQDSPDDLQQVKNTVEKRKLTFRQFMDKEGAVAEQFKVSGIPCTVLIDGQGVVQWIHTGGSPSLKKEISEKLDKLLKGESLVKKEEKTEPEKK
jgi:thiol-disulfide isomerase/thioredoxin